VHSNRRFQFQERSQLFIRAHDERLSVVAMCDANPHRSSVGINRRGAAPTASGFAEIVSDDLPNTSRGGSLTTADPTA
jgi:hypothetical protein